MVYLFIGYMLAQMAWICKRLYRLTVHFYKYHCNFVYYFIETMIIYPSTYDIIHNITLQKSYQKIYYFTLKL